MTNKRVKAISKKIVAFGKRWRIRLRESKTRSQRRNLCNWWISTIAIESTTLNSFWQENTVFTSVSSIFCSSCLRYPNTRKKTCLRMWSCSKSHTGCCGQSASPCSFTPSIMKIKSNLLITRYILWCYATLFTSSILTTKGKMRTNFQKSCSSTSKYAAFSSCKSFIIWCKRVSCSVSCLQFWRVPSLPLGCMSYQLTSTDQLLRCSAKLLAIPTLFHSFCAPSPRFLHNYSWFTILWKLAKKAFLLPGTRRRQCKRNSNLSSPILRRPSLQRATMMMN